MIKKVVKFFTDRRKTISDKELKEAKEKLKELLYNNGNMLDLEVNETLIRLQEKIDYLIKEDYHEEMLKGLNGILIELIDKSISNNKIIPSSLEKLREALKKYESFMDEMLIKSKEESKKDELLLGSENEKVLKRFEDVVESINEDLKNDKGIF